MGLSIYVLGMTLMRLATGSVLRKISPKVILHASLGFVLAGVLTMQLASSLAVSIFGLFVLGLGLAGGFPIMFGFVGGRFTELSGTAFSLVIVAALIGNMLINYLMGAIAQSAGVVYLTWVAAAEWVAMALLVWAIGRRLEKTV
ncbi:MAG: hypothetical protein IPN74_10730 [Haliscomenobacter sp.]|nr:hypothetical protein [Haliscomenobacter sp.]